MVRTVFKWALSVCIKDILLLRFSRNVYRQYHCSSFTRVTFLAVAEWRKFPYLCQFCEQTNNNIRVFVFWSKSLKSASIWCCAICFFLLWYRLHNNIESFYIFFISNIILLRILINIVPMYVLMSSNHNRIRDSKFHFHAIFSLFGICVCFVSMPLFHS